MNPKNIIKKINQLPLKIKILFPIVVTIILVLVKVFFANTPQDKSTYETTTVEKGTLISSISSTGTITSGNYNNITTKASGTVNNVYVTNGDIVKKGQKIAEITLDDYATERQTATWVSYLEAKETALEAVNQKAVTDISMWQARQDVLDAQEAYDDMLTDDTNPATHEVYTSGERIIIEKTLDQKKKAFSVAEAKYLNSGSDIGNANAKVAAAYRNYQENSSTIYATADGTISDLSLAAGLALNANSSTSSTSGATIVSSQTVGKVNDTTAQLVATVNLTEIDIVSVQANQKVNLTLDAYPDLSFTGKVLAVNTSGTNSSGVTNYPVTIILDPVDIAIYPNMAVSADIITNIETDVLLVPTTAIKSINNQSVVDVQKDGQISSVVVETGHSNDSQTVITSGLSEGDIIVTSTLTQTDNSMSTTSQFGNNSSSNNRSGPPGGMMIGF